MAPYDSPPDILDVIRQRSSCRNYQTAPLGGEHRRRLEAYLAAVPPAPFPGRCRFQLVDAFESEPEKARQLGTYGNIKGATAFVVGAVAKGVRDLEAFGHQMENIILEATGMELGTCWLGGTFDRGGFGRAIGVREDEQVPAVTPVGYPAPGMGLRDRFLRWSANSKNRFPWETLFFKGGGVAPLPREHAGPYATVLEMVRLAPSASNKQPWRILKEPERHVYHLFLQRSRLYGRMAEYFLGAEDIQRLDMGIALCHFERAARALGLPGRWETRAPQAADWTERMEYCLTWNGVP